MLMFAFASANTPDRTEWIAAHVPGMGFLQHGTNTMSEFGFRYEDPDIGIFQSRLTPDQLRREDATRGAEVAVVLNRYGDNYKGFLRDYRPGVDPLAHETRVHLFRRDR